jgi:hypothetical protein
MASWMRRFRGWKVRVTCLRSHKELQHPQRVAILLLSPPSRSLALSLTLFAGKIMSIIQSDPRVPGAALRGGL